MRHQYDPSSFNLFEQSFSKKLVESNSQPNGGAEANATQDTQDVVESLSRLSPSILIGPNIGNYTTSPQYILPAYSPLMMMHSPFKHEPQPVLDPEEKKRIVQERNRQAAVKSRLKKKHEWYRLLETQQLLQQENDLLKYRIQELESILTGQMKGAQSRSNNNNNQIIKTKTISLAMTNMSSVSHGRRSSRRSASPSLSRPSLPSCTGVPQC